VNDLLAGLLSALVSTNAPVAVSNLVHQRTGVAIAVTDPNDPVERAYQKVLAEDDAALGEIGRWREDLEKPGIKASAVEISLLNNRVRQRAAPVRRSYETFLEQNPRHINARVAFAAFLDEISESEEAERQLEKAVEVDPNSPAALNNLANHFGHSGKLNRAFSLYEQAMRLAPMEPLYCENLATIVFTFRRDAMDHYRLTEQEVFTKALGLYRKALELDPKNFDRAVELAKTYYGVTSAASDDPEARRKNQLKLGDEALAAWQVAYGLASDEAEREGVRLHLARWQINAGRFEEARKNLHAITNETFVGTRNTLLKKLETRSAR
jgi:Flp pilus assembly protein TadD